MRHYAWQGLAIKISPNNQHCTHLSDAINVKNGHKGRIGIFEVLPITPPMAELILTQASAAKIDALARTQGHDNLRQAGIKKVLTGQISLTEMHRVTSESWLNH